MERTRWLVIPILATLTLLFGALPGRAADTYRNTFTTHLPPNMGQMTSFDISFVDPGSQTYALADGSNKSVDVYNAANGHFIRHSVEVFTGAPLNCPATGANRGGNGPNGVYIVPSADRDAVSGDSVALSPTSLAALEDGARVPVYDDEDDEAGGRGNAWAGDGKSQVIVINLDTGAQVGSNIPTGGVCRADELWYSPEDHEIMIGNPDEPTAAPGVGPFETFISTSGTPGPKSVKARLVYDGTGGAYGASGGNCKSTSGLIPGGNSITVCHSPTGDVAGNGLEQPIYTRGHSDADDDRDDEHGRFWLAVPGTSGDGRVDEINPDTYKVLHSIPMPDCGPTGPTGLTIVNDHEAAAACPSGVEFVNLSKLSEDGKPVPESGGADQIWFNPGDGNVYAPNRNNVAGCGQSVTVDTTTPQSGQITVCVAVAHWNGSPPTQLTAEVQLPADGGSHSVAANPNNNWVFVPVADLDCTGNEGCPPKGPTASDPCTTAAEEGGCPHDQGIAIVQHGP